MYNELHFRLYTAREIDTFLFSRNRQARQDIATLQRNSVQNFTLYFIKTRKRRLTILPVDQPTRERKFKKIFKFTLRSQ